MRGIFKNNKNIWLFVCGFLIGIFLEIILIERKKFNMPSKHEKNMQVTCLVLLKHNHLRYINSTKKTWLTRCSNYYIVKVQRHGKSIKQKKKSGTLNSEDEHHNLIQQNRNSTKEMKDFGGAIEIMAKSAWSGLCKALHITKTSHSNWLIIVSDSLIVLIENLKLYVKNLNYNDDYYYGYALKNYEANYNVLSAGILISRGTLKKLFEKFKTDIDCDLSGKYWRNEDLFLGKYLKQMNILPKDTRDEKGRGRFHGYNLHNILWPGRLFTRSDYIKKALYPVSKGFNCCSPLMITMEVSDPDAMYNLFFFFYKLTIAHKEVSKHANYKTSKGFTWKDFLREEGYNSSAIENMTSEEYYKIWEKKLPLDLIYLKTRNFLKNHKEDLD